MQKNDGITLISLVITILVLAILAGVLINVSVEDNGLITRAEESTSKFKEWQENQVEILNGVETEYANKLNQTIGADVEEFETPKEKIRANAPVLATGMSEIMFASNGDTITKSSAEFDAENWYNYEEKRWANAQTVDGSMWVWIPRFAYKLDSTTQTSNVKFLIGTTNKWYNPETKQEEDLPEGYIVHPCFQNGTSNSYENGEWDKEITGIWVAKFEAGYATGGNSATKVASSVNYTQTTAYISSEENGGNGDATQPARNWLDGEYAVKNEAGTYSWKNGTTTAISYPTFQGNTYSMNYININDAFNISKALTEPGNIYGLTTATDSHLIKNSEWGATTYLSASQYGLNGTEIAINDTNLNNTVSSVYAVTGGGDYRTNVAQSTTGNIYGIFDMSGGVWERTAAYVANGNSNLKTYGASLAYTGDTLKTTSTKYTTVYPYDSTKDNTEQTDYDIASAANYALNTKIYGDGVRETSTVGTGTKSWNNEYSYYPSLYLSFFGRSGRFDYVDASGAFAFTRTGGNSYWCYGFRVVLIAE